MTGVYRSVVTVAVFPVLCVGSCLTPGCERGRLVSRRRRPTTTSEGSMTASRGTQLQTDEQLYFLNFCVLG